MSMKNRWRKKFRRSGCPETINIKNVLKNFKVYKKTISSIKSPTTSIFRSNLVHFPKAAQLKFTCLKAAIETLQVVTYVTKQ